MVFMSFDILTLPCYLSKYMSWLFLMVSLPVGCERDHPCPTTHGTASPRYAAGAGSHRLSHGVPPSYWRFPYGDLNSWMGSTAMANPLRIYIAAHQSTQLPAVMRGFHTVETSDDLGVPYIQVLMSWTAGGSCLKRRVVGQNSYPQSSTTTTPLPVANICTGYCFRVQWRLKSGQVG